MAPSPLHGLNIVHTTRPSTFGSDSQDLLSTPFPGLDAQLEIWNHLTFDSDESGIPKDNDKDDEPADDDRDEEMEREGSAPPDGHTNVVKPTNVVQPPAAHPNVDLGSILAGLGIDPFLVPPISPSMMQPAQMATSLQQLLQTFAQPSPPFLSQQQAESHGIHDGTPQTKRARSGKSSNSSPSPTESTGLSPTEDKRRRNTAASARFRLKKKEREVALEQKSKDLEVKVNELERECEALRRENGWLKGLVVGVTGASAAPVQPMSVGNKRRREEEGKTK